MPQDVTLVTGASTGIGAALVRRIARERRNVVLVARTVDRLESLATEMRDAHHVDAQVIPADLTKPGAVRQLVDEVDRRGLAVDWLVNNAGFGTGGRFDQLPVERELEEITLNVTALVELTGRLLPGMVARRRGAVVNVSSLASFLPGPYSATYSATKAFVTSFSEAIATETPASPSSASAPGSPAPSSRRARRSTSRACPRWRGCRPRRSRTRPYGPSVGRRCS